MLIVTQINPGSWELRPAWLTALQTYFKSITGLLVLSSSEKKTLGKNAFVGLLKIDCGFSMGFFWVLFFLTWTRSCLDVHCVGKKTPVINVKNPQLRDWVTRVTKHFLGHPELPPVLVSWNRQFLGASGLFWAAPLCSTDVGHRPGFLCSADMSSPCFVCWNALPGVPVSLEDLWPAKLGDAVTDAAVEEVGTCGYPQNSRLKWPCLGRFWG